jgi:hypothetical protein
MIFMYFFFKESRAFAARNTQLFSFISTASVALWNLRWQVQGYVDVRPAANAKELSDRFASGTDIQANNLKGTCIDTPWEDQLGQFAQIVSANLIAMYEGWAEELMPKFGDPRLAAQVQWPSRGQYGRKAEGINEAITQVRSSGVSTEMNKAFFPVYSANRKYSPARLDSWLALYRYHKEVRNSLMHRGGIANDWAESAWCNASTLTRADIGLRSSPHLTKITEGAMVGTDIHEAIQLSDVLLRIVCTIDAELCFTDLAEHTFLNDCKHIEKVQEFRELPSDPARKARRINSLCVSAEYPSPADTESVYELGRRAGIIAYLCDLFATF